MRDDHLQTIPHPERLACYVLAATERIAKRILEEKANEHTESE